MNKPAATNLAGLQQDFQDYLLGHSDAVIAAVAPHDRLPASDLLGVYRYAYTQRLVEALATDFPGLHGLLGADRFAALARGYVARHPSQNPSLRWLGQALVGYLESNAVPDLPPLAADMARFDWAVAQAFDARDETPLTMADVLALPPAAWESFRLTFAASVSIFAGDAALGDLRRALLRDTPLPTEASGAQCSWLVWRQAEDVQFRAAAASERVCFDHMQGGGTFGAMCELLMTESDVDEPALRCAECIKDWVERGLVVGLDHDAALSS